MIELIKYKIKNIREQKPLIINITNIVSVDLVANIQLSIGASPIISNSPREAEELMDMAACLVINIGTLDDQFMELVKIYIDSAKKLNKKIILDPVGAGASKLRTEAAKEFLNSAHIIRGNASEIANCFGIKAKIKGVDSMVTTENIIEDLQKKAGNKTVIISGKIDYIISDEKIAKCKFGNEIMTKVTGMGCAMNGVIAAFASLDEEFKTITASVNLYGMAGEDAAKVSKGPADFKNNFINQIYNW